MIFPIVALVALLARASAQGDCVSGFLPLMSCVSKVQGECAEGQTLIDVLDPTELCTGAVSAADSRTCGEALGAQATTYADQGCCTLNSLLPAMEQFGGGDNSCGANSEPLSYEGFAATINYFCASEEVEGEDFYCLTDGLDFLEEVGPHVLQYQQLVMAGQTENAEVYFANNVDCDTIAESACCYPSIKEFVDSCGDEAAKTKLSNLDLFLAAMPSLCSDILNVNVTFDGLCPGLSDINNCFAATDPSCEGIGDDDDAAFSVVPTFAAAFAAVLGFLFFARQH